MAAIRQKNKRNIVVVAMVILGAIVFSNVILTGTASIRDEVQLLKAELASVKTTFGERTATLEKDLENASLRSTVESVVAAGGIVTSAQPAVAHVEEAATIVANLIEATGLDPSNAEAHTTIDASSATKNEEKAVDQPGWIAEVIKLGGTYVSADCDKLEQPGMLQECKPLPDNILSQMPQTSLISNCTGVDVQEALTCAVVGVKNEYQAGVQSTFRIDCTVQCGDVQHGVPGLMFNVYLRGPALADADAVDIRNGSYIIMVDLEDPGDYNINAHIRHKIPNSWNGGCESSFSMRVWEPVNNDGTKLRVKGQPINNVEVPVCDNISVPGRWVRELNVEHGQTHPTWNDDYVWRNHGCKLRHFTAAQFLSCAESQQLSSVAFMGDSQTRSTFATLIDFLAGGTTFGRKFHEGAHHCFLLNATRDSSFCIYFSWTPHANDGADVLEAWRNDRNDDFWFINHGQWEGAYNCLATHFKDQLKEEIKIMQEENSKRVITWMTTKALDNDTDVPIGASRTNANTAARILTLNRITERMVREAGIDIMDTFALTRPRADTMCDGAHFACNAGNAKSGDWLDNLKNAAELHMEGPVVFTELQFMFNKMCPPEAWAKVRT